MTPDDIRRHAHEPVDWMVDCLAAAAFPVRALGPGGRSLPDGRGGRRG